MLTNFLILLGKGDVQYQKPMIKADRFLLLKNPMGLTCVSWRISFFIRLDNIIYDSEKDFQSFFEKSETFFVFRKSKIDVMTI